MSPPARALSIWVFPVTNERAGPAVSAGAGSAAGSLPVAPVAAGAGPPGAGPGAVEVVPRFEEAPGRLRVVALLQASLRVTGLGLGLGEGIGAGGLGGLRVAPGACHR